MVAIDFGDFSGIDMRDSGALGELVFSEFDGFDFWTGAFDDVHGMLEIPSTSNPGAYVLAYGAWAFHSDGTPTDGSTIYAIEVWDPSGYRVVIDEFDVSFPTLRDALEGKDLSSLYAGHELMVMGQSFPDTLDGGSLDDEIYGYGGSDTLFGRGGDDYLDGMARGDTMLGGWGDDDYAVNHVRDVVDERDGQGIDGVVASIDYVLPAFVEDLAFLEAGGALDGDGNALDNLMLGNSFANAMAGGGGNDTLYGFEGRDGLEGAGGKDRLIGGTGRDVLRGGSGADVLDWDPSDRIDGGNGTDTLRVGQALLDFRQVDGGAIVDIERIKLVGAESSQLRLGEQDVLDLSSSTDEIRVLGGAGDVVNLSASFVEAGMAGSYIRYESGAAVLLIDSDIAVV